MIPPLACLALLLAGCAAPVPPPTQSATPAAFTLTPQANTEQPICPLWYGCAPGSDGRCLPHTGVTVTCWGNEVVRCDGNAECVVGYALPGGAR
jgi:hypothetical protein